MPARLRVALNPRDPVAKEYWSTLADRYHFDPNAAEIDVLDLELELDLFRRLSPTSALGAGIVVYGEKRDMTEQAVNALEFFRNESCGKCVPCRIGSQKMATLGGHLLARRISADEWRDLLPAVKDLEHALGMASICGLGRAVPTGFKTLIDLFGDDLEARLTRTPAEASR